MASVLVVDVNVAVDEDVIGDVVIGVGVVVDVVVGVERDIVVDGDVVVVVIVVVDLDGVGFVDENGDEDVDEEVLGF